MMQRPARTSSACVTNSSGVSVPRNMLSAAWASEPAMRAAAPRTEYVSSVLATASASSGNWGLAWANSSNFFRPKNIATCVNQFIVQLLRWRRRPCLRFFSRRFLWPLSQRGREYVGAKKGVSQVWKVWKVYTAFLFGRVAQQKSAQEAISTIRTRKKVHFSHLARAKKWLLRRFCEVPNCGCQETVLLRARGPVTDIPQPKTPAWLGTIVADRKSTRLNSSHIPLS